MLVFIIKLLSLSSLRRVPICQGFSHFSGFLNYFAIAKLATSSMRVNTQEFLRGKIYFENLEKEYIIPRNISSKRRVDFGSICELISEICYCLFWLLSLAQLICFRKLFNSYPHLTVLYICGQKGIRGNGGYITFCFTSS